MVRGDLVEGVHHGSLVLLDPDGVTELVLGDTDAPCYPRSCHKPLQAAALVGAGWTGRDEALALAAASHAGSPRQLAGVRAILAAAGCSEQDLRTPPDWPLDRHERDALLLAGGTPSPVAMNCSGKHAAMLATCAHNGWSLVDYLDPAHPVQRACREQIVAATGVEPATTSVDGCGAPLHASTLHAMARAYRGAVSGAPGEPLREVADAMRAHPDLVSGPGRLVTELMRAVPGLLVKDGAEAVCVGALADGRAFALKVADGGERAVPPLVGAVLARWGIAAPPALVHAPLLGGGVEVGEVRALLP